MGNQGNKHCSFVYGQEKVDKDEAAVEIKGRDVGDLLEARGIPLTFLWLIRLEKHFLSIGCTIFTAFIYIYNAVGCVTGCKYMG